MKLILKNSTILFQNKNYQEINPTSVLNTPSAYYVIDNGSRVDTGGSGDGNILYVNVYQVTAGTTYYIKSITVQTNPSTMLSASVGIAFGTNLLNSSGNISNHELIKSFDVRDTTLGDFTVEFTPNQNGYIYITEVNITSEPSVCLSSLFV